MSICLNTLAWFNIAISKCCYKGGFISYVTMTCIQKAISVCKYHRSGTAIRIADFLEVCIYSIVSHKCHKETIPWREATI